MNDLLPNLLIFYGIFLISCGITAVIFIGMKAKTALVSGSTSGGVSLTIAFMIHEGHEGFRYAGIILSLALFVVFSWRATKTLFSVFDMIQTNHTDLKSKGIAFLIIALMAVVSVLMVGLQLAVLL